jgi:hypothetical protein
MMPRLSTARRSAVPRSPFAGTWRLLLVGLLWKPLESLSASATSLRVGDHVEFEELAFRSVTPSTEHHGKKTAVRLEFEYLSEDLRSSSQAAIQTNANHQTHEFNRGLISGDTTSDSDGDEGEGAKSNSTAADKNETATLKSSVVDIAQKSP